MYCEAGVDRGVNSWIKPFARIVCYLPRRYFPKPPELYQTRVINPSALIHKIYVKSRRITKCDLIQLLRQFRQICGVSILQ